MPGRLRLKTNIIRLRKRDMGVTLKIQMFFSLYLFKPFLMILASFVQEPTHLCSILFSYVILYFVLLYIYIYNTANVQRISYTSHDGRHSPTIKSLPNRRGLLLLLLSYSFSTLEYYLFTKIKIIPKKKYIYNESTFWL